MDWSKLIDWLLKSNQLRKLMYTLLLFLFLSYLTPVSYASLFNKIDVGFLTPTNFLYIALFVVSYLIVDLISLVYIHITKKQKLEKETHSHYLLIKELDREDKEVLSLFIKKNKNTLELRHLDNNVASLKANGIIIEIGKTSFPDYRRLFQINPKYKEVIKQVYLEEVQ